MFGLGATELIILLAIILVLFGSTRIPQLMGGLGQGIKNFKKAMKEPDSIDVTPKADDQKKDETKKS